MTLKESSERLKRKTQQIASDFQDITQDLRETIPHPLRDRVLKKTEKSTEKGHPLTEGRPLLTALRELRNRKKT
jgi:hypothetical protein